MPAKVLMKALSRPVSFTLPPIRSLLAGRSRRIAGKHSSAARAAWGVPSTMNGNMLSMLSIPFRLPISMKSETSLFTHSDFADSGEQTTMRCADASSASWIWAGRFPALSSSTSRKIGPNSVGKSGRPFNVDGKR